MALQTLGATMVEGVVHPSGAGGHRGAGDTHWTLLFSLQPWREAGAAMNEGRLHVQKTVTDAELETFRDLIRPYRVLRARVVPGAEHRAQLVEVLDYDGQVVDLVQRAQQLKEPTTIEDPLFGTLTLNRAIDVWEGQALWRGSQVQLLFDLDDTNDGGPSLQTARSLWADQPAWDRRVREFAVQELLALKNDSWLDDDEQELSPSEFASRMTLESISCFPGGEFTFLHDDGDLFWGHAIEVRGNLRDGPTRADIPG